MNKLLIVINLQNDFIVGSLSNSETKRVAIEILKYIKSYKGTIMYIRDTHEHGYLDTEEGKELPVLHCFKGSEGWKLIDDIKLKPSDIVMNKHQFTCYDLLTYLKATNTTEVELCGFQTGNDIISNATFIKNLLPKVNIKVHEKLCACNTIESHQSAIDTMRAFQITII